jgi:hypothetical protein
MSCPSHSPWLEGRLSEECVQVRGFLWIFVTSFIFLHWAFSPTPNPQAGRSPLVGCPRMLIQYIRSYLPSATWGRAMPWWQGTHLTWPEDHAFNTVLALATVRRSLHKKSLLSFKLKPTHYLVLPNIRWLDTKSLLRNLLKNLQPSKIFRFIRIVFTNAGGKEKSYWLRVVPSVRDVDSWMSEGLQRGHVHTRIQTVFVDLFCYWISFSYLHSTEALGKSSLDGIPGSLSGQMHFLNRGKCQHFCCSD